MRRLIGLTCLMGSGWGCLAAEQDPPSVQVDLLAAELVARAGVDRVVVEIDHCRLAAEKGVTMPPSTVVLFSDRETNAALMQLDPRIGLDLPHKALAFADPGEKKARVAYATAGFLRARYGVTDNESLQRYERELEAVLEGFEEDQRHPVEGSGIEAGFGMVSILSEHDFKATVERLRQVVLAQGDTVWFGEVDYQAEAAELGIELPSATLLLFGGPQPGGMAMAQAPRLGLDAFCQKLLVLEGEKGVELLFNRIEDFARMHYGNATRPQQGIDVRLEATFQRAAGGAALTERGPEGATNP